VAVTTDASGNVFVCGATVENQEGRFYLAKHAAPDGTPMWTKIFDVAPSAGMSATALAVDAAGDIILGGTVGGASPTPGSDIYAAKFSGTNGDLIWG